MITATSDLGKSLQKLREMVATSATFKAAWGNVYADALTHIFIGRQWGQLERPCAVIDDEGLTESLIAGGSMNFLRPSGEIRLHMERDTSPLYEDPSDQRIDAMDFFSKVITEIGDLAAKDFTTGAFGESHLPTINCVLEMVEENEPQFHHSLGRFYIARARLSWGDG